MIRTIGKAVLAVVLGAAITVPAISAEQNSETIVIAGGAPFGYFYGLAGAICQSVNKEAPDGLNCFTVANGDSARNLAGLSDGSIDFAIVQSDWLHHAYKGTSRYRAEGPNTELRSLAAVPVEALTILARREIGAKVFTHLSHRRVGYASTNGYAGLLMRAVAASAKVELNEVEGISAETGDAAAQICDGKIDVYVTVERHPSGRSDSLMARCNLNLISIDLSNVAKVVKTRPALARQDIKAGTYLGETSAVSTVGLQAILVTQSSTTDERVSKLLAAMFPDTDKASAIPAVAPVPSEESLERLEKIAPLHRKAVTFYQSKFRR